MPITQFLNGMLPKSNDELCIKTTENAAGVKLVVDSETCIQFGFTIVEGSVHYQVPTAIAYSNFRAAFETTQAFPSHLEIFRQRTDAELSTQSFSRVISHLQRLNDDEIQKMSKAFIKYTSQTDQL